MAGVGISKEFQHQIIIAEVCQRFGWTLQQYDAQPQWILDMIVEKMKFESEEAKKAELEAKRQSNKYGG